MKRILASIICIGIVAFVSCSYENTATVTIDTGIRQQAQLSLFDRVLAFFSLAQPLKADPVPSLGYTVSSIILTISASNMETIQEEIPLDTGKITLEVPAGSQRTFELLVYTPYDLNYDDSTPDRYYGGIATVDLSPGQQVNLNIEIGELPLVSINYDQAYAKFYIYVTTQYIDNLDFVNLYISDDNINWNFIIKVDKSSFIYDTVSLEYIYDIYQFYQIPKYYKVVGYNKYGFGEESTLYLYY